MNTHGILAGGSVILRPLYPGQPRFIAPPRWKVGLLLAWLVAGCLISTLGHAQPLLQAILAKDGGWVVEWNEPGYRLESADSLSNEPAWESVTILPSVVDGRFHVELTPVDSALFLRLRADAGGPPPDPGTIASSLPVGQGTSFADATSFLYASTRPVQTGVVPGAVVAERVCVLKGTALDRSGQPLEGVLVRWLDHPEVGQTQTRKDGHYDLVVKKP